MIIYEILHIWFAYVSSSNNFIQYILFYGIYMKNIIHLDKNPYQSVHNITLCYKKQSTSRLCDIFDALA